MRDWQELVELTGGAGLIVERVRLKDKDIAVEGAFELPPLASMSADDQAFVAAFVKCHGSIKQMEQWFGVSYPTIKNRLNRIAETLDFVEVEISRKAEIEEKDRADVLAQLERGEITVDEALEELNS